MTRLCELAIKYGTDKCPDWANGTGHSYTPFYDELFRGKTVKRVMELGINRGASLFMWAEYWPGAKIIGVDNHLGALNDVASRLSNCIGLLNCDCGDKIDLCRLAGSLTHFSFDLIIDDASHNPEHQILAANTLYSLLAPNGIYIIEDVRSPEAAGLIQSQLLHPSEIVSFNISAKEDDRLIILRRPA